MLRGIFNETGGRQVNNDDFYILQDQLFKAIELQYQGNGAFIIQGCTVTGTAGSYSISAGLVYIDGKILQFNAVSSITSFPKYMHQATPVDQDNYPLEQGGSAYKRTQYKAELVSSAPLTGEYLIMTSTGGRNYNDVLASNFVRLSGNQNVVGQKTFSSTIQGDISGNAGSVTNGVYTTGNQTIAGSKTFSSQIQGDISGNAGTVSNGVYTAGNQTIAGTKTFSSQIQGDISGNAGTVSNGVYTTGNQTISGTKTFSSTIQGNISGNAATANNATNATNASHATNADNATNATNATNAGYANNANLLDGNDSSAFVFVSNVPTILSTLKPGSAPTNSTSNGLDSGFLTTATNTYTYSSFGYSPTTYTVPYMNLNFCCFMSGGGGSTLTVSIDASSDNFNWTRTLKSTTYSYLGHMGGSMVNLNINAADNSATTSGTMWYRLRINCTNAVQFTTGLDRTVFGIMRY